MSLGPASSRTAADRGIHLDEAAAFWSKRAGRPFTTEDAREATTNLCGVLSLLREWQEKEAGEVPQGSSERVDPQSGGVR